MQVKIKKLHVDAVIPAYSKPGDAGMDLTAVSATQDQYGNVVYGTGLAVEIPLGYVGLIFPRSSNSKTDLYLTNHVGVVDSGYRGEIMFKFRPVNGLLNAKVFQVGERVGQLIILPYPSIEFDEVDELSDSERGDGGFGSTGK
jgi:dUTP pyrophosphatase